MPPFSFVLAHGALGPFDEIIFLGVGVVFFVLMGVSWLRSRDQAADDVPPSPQPETPGITPHETSTDPAARDAADRYTLD